MVYLVSNQTRCIEDPEIKLGTVQDCLEYFKDKEEIGFDLETMGFDPYTKKILSIQLGDKENQFVFDGTEHIPQLKELLEDESKLFLGHNLKFDLRFTLYHNIVVKNVYDTFIAEQIVWNGYEQIRKSLDFVVERYTNAQIDKSIRGDIHRVGLTPKVIKYGADDVKFLGDIKEKQLQKAKKLDIHRAIELNNYFVPVIAYLEFCGFKLDKERWQQKIELDIAEMSRHQKKLNEFIISENLTDFIEPQLDLFSPGRKTNINWNSPQQVVKFFKLLGIDTAVLDKESGEIKDTVGEDHLKKQINKHPMVESYINFRKSLKRVSTYGKNWFKFINPVTQRIHTQYQQWMNTGRMSSGGKDKTSKIELPNAQNIPADKQTRRCIVPEEGNVLINADYSSQEVRIFTNKSKDPALLEMFEKGLTDQHSFTAWQLFPTIQKKYPKLDKETLKKIKNNFPDQRTLSKQANFAIQYGGTGSTIAENCNVSIEVGQGVYDTYFKMFKGVKSYFDQCYRYARRKGHILFNHVTRAKYFIPKNLSNSKLRTRSYNYPIQGTAADMIKYAGILYWRHLVKNNLVFKVLITIICHDEYLLETSKELAEQESLVLKNCMEEAADRFCDVPRIPAEPVIENYWTH